MLNYQFYFKHCKIHQAILGGFLDEFAQSVKECGVRIVEAAIEIYNNISTDLLPTPDKSHYVFNLRDLSKCVQGILRADEGTIRAPVSCFIVLSIVNNFLQIALQK